MTQRARIVLPLLVGTAAVALWAVWGWYVETRFPVGPKVPDGLQQAMALRGQFGDMFGGISALFSALILAGAIYTLWLQHRELEALQKQQLESRHENARTATLLAYAGMVNAKAALLNSRYQIGRDLMPDLMRMDPATDAAGVMFKVTDAAFKQVGATTGELEALANDLAEMISELKKTASEATQARQR